MNESIQTLAKLLADNIGNRLTVALADGIILHVQQSITQLAKQAEDAPAEIVPE